MTLDLHRKRLIPRPDGLELLVPLIVEPPLCIHIIFFTINNATILGIDEQDWQSAREISYFDDSAVYWSKRLWYGLRHNGLFTTRCKSEHYKKKRCKKNGSVHD